MRISDWSSDVCSSDLKSVSCLWFNGWAFQGFDDAKTVLIEASARLQDGSRAGSRTAASLCQGAAGRVVARGVKLSQETVRTFLHAEGLSFKKVEIGRAHV